MRRTRRNDLPRASAGRPAGGATKRGMAAATGAVVVLFASVASAGQQADARRKAEQATQALRAGDYPKALDGYRQAEVMFPDSPELAYNQAVAHYRLREFDKAREGFNKALTTRDLALERKAKFNLGNCAYAEALERISDLPTAIDRLRLAISHYRDAIDLDPQDSDAKANIELAQLLIKDLLDKQKQQQEQQKQQQDPQCSQSQPSQTQPQPQTQPQSDQPRPDQKPQDHQQPQDQKNAAQEQPEQAQQQKGEDQQQAEAAAKEHRSMSSEEADRLLQAVRDKEKQRRDAQRRRMPVGRVPVDKDW